MQINYSNLQYTFTMQWLHVKENNAQVFVGYIGYFKKAVEGEISSSPVVTMLGCSADLNLPFQRIKSQVNIQGCQKMHHI